MAAIFLEKDAQELLKNKYIVVMGGSIQRSIYKDLIRLLQGNTFLTDNLLRMKGEDSCLKDKLLDGGMRGKDKKGIGYREVRQYQTDFYFLQFVFMTRCFNSYVDSVITKFENSEQKPDVIIVNSCLWDITRYGDRPVPEYKANLQKLFKRLKSSLPDCLVIWNTNPAISHNPKGGVFIPGLDYLKDSMELHVLEANYYASKVAVENGHDVVDLHYFLRHQIHRRAEDGIHWDMTGHRRITNLLLTHIAQTWGVKMPGHIELSPEVETAKTEDKKSEKLENKTNKLNLQDGKSIFDEVEEEIIKPKHDDVVEVKVEDKKKPEPPKKASPKRPIKRGKRRRGGKWNNQRHSPVPTHTYPSVQNFEYNHQPQMYNFQHNSGRNSPQFAHQVPNRPNPFLPQNQVHQYQQQQPNFNNNPFHQQDFSHNDFQMLNFDNGQWQPYQDEEPTYAHQRHLIHNPEPHRFNPYQRGRGRGGMGMF